MLGIKVKGDDTAGSKAVDSPKLVLDVANVGDAKSLTIHMDDLE
jgi:O-acetylhomoserine/O-acetylserine sulfhydrylase-like pyridoxal-dependent enzyme